MTSPEDLLEHDGPADCTMKIKNQSGHSEFPAPEIFSVDALALVRFGLRAADDPRIVNTVKITDANLKTETRTGPVWHRYSHDGYGETADGGRFKSMGIGRGWPLPGGERAHYERSVHLPSAVGRSVGRPGFRGQFLAAEVLILPLPIMQAVFG